MPKEKFPAVLGEEEASHLLLDALRHYQDRPIEELVTEVGIGDDYYITLEGDHGLQQGYSISITNEWQSQSKTRLVLTARIFGPSVKEGGVLPELHSESVVVEVQ